MHFSYVYACALVA